MYCADPGLCNSYPTVLIFPNMRIRCPGSKESSGIELKGLKVALHLLPQQLSSLTISVPAHQGSDHPRSGPHQLEQIHATLPLYPEEMLRPLFWYPQCCFSPGQGISCSLLGTGTVLIGSTLHGITFLPSTSP